MWNLRHIWDTAICHATRVLNIVHNVSGGILDLTNNDEHAVPKSNPVLRKHLSSAASALKLDPRVIDEGSHQMVKRLRDKMYTIAAVGACAALMDPDTNIGNPELVEETEKILSTFPTVSRLRAHPPLLDHVITGIVQKLDGLINAFLSRSSEDGRRPRNVYQHYIKDAKSKNWSLPVITAAAYSLDLYQQAVVRRYFDFMDDILREKMALRADYDIYETMEVGDYFTLRDISEALDKTSASENGIFIYLNYCKFCVMTLAPLRPIHAIPAEGPNDIHFVTADHMTSLDFLWVNRPPPKHPLPAPHHAVRVKERVFS